MSGLTKANFLRDAGVKTSVFARFSTVTLGREFPDSARNPRGFALKLYTGEGNYDIVGLNFPIFFCRDPIQRPDVIRSQARSPKNFLLDYNSLFDLLANSPEGNHAGMMFFSHHGTPVGWRHEHGYRCHTFKWVNQDGKFVYIKYHFLADGGQKQFSMPEAIKTCGEDPDFAKRELWDAIENGERVSWTAHVQIMEPDEADPTKLGFDPFDLTKVWPRDQFPMHEFGKLVLNKIRRTSIAMLSRQLSHQAVWYPVLRIAQIHCCSSECFSTGMHNIIELVSICTKFQSIVRSCPVRCRA